MEDFALLFAIILILALLIWILKLQLQVYSLQRDLLERERWHWRELNRNRRL